jgi:hypothetical protein
VQAQERAASVFQTEQLVAREHNGMAQRARLARFCTDLAQCDLRSTETVRRGGMLYDGVEFLDGAAVISHSFVQPMIDTWHETLLFFRMRVCARCGRNTCRQRCGQTWLRRDAVCAGDVIAA